MKFNFQDSVHNKPPSIQVMAWYWQGDEPVYDDYMNVRIYTSSGLKELPGKPHIFLNATVIKKIYGYVQTHSCGLCPTIQIYPRFPISYQCAASMILRYMLLMGLSEISRVALTGMFFSFSFQLFGCFNKYTYTQYKNKLTTILRKKEKDYYKLLLEANKNNLKKTWSIIRSVINNCKPSKLNESFIYNGSAITDKNDVSNKFNDYFVNVGKTLAAQIPTSGPSFHRYLPEANKECIFLTPTDDREIRNIILNIRNSAPGYDGISSKCINPIIDTLVTPLTYITNLSLTEGVFPCELKIAQVLPLYKNNDPMLFNNYRPVSLLPFFSKVFERLMYDRLIDFIEKHHLLYQFQFGFRKDHSTFMALVILLEKITEALDNSQFGICILVDFRKAFDTVEHNILLEKLYHYGIRGNAVQWFNSYLSNRYQYVNYNNTSSDMKLITCGVPQGSILGSLLFLLYINDIASVSNIFSILFADDTTLFYSSKSLQELATVINNELRKVIEWLNANRLSLNIDKTNFMIFRPKGKNEKLPHHSNKWV